MHDTDRPATVYEGRYLRVVKRDRWEYATRPNATGVVGVVALHDDGRIVLIEQYRVPAGARVIEIPAGLAGDDDDGESLLDAAQRELKEETGYTARHWRPLVTGMSSPGMTDETITFFLATGLQKRGSGGGVDGEDITVHEVDFNNLMPWLNQQVAAGKRINLTLLASVFAATTVGE